MMISEKIFNGFKINIAGFSLGNHVLKNCLKELENFGKLDIINIYKFCYFIQKRRTQAVN